MGNKESSLVFAKGYKEISTQFPEIYLMRVYCKARCFIKTDQIEYEAPDFQKKVRNNIVFDNLDRELYMDITFQIKNAEKCDDIYEEIKQTITKKYRDFIIREKLYNTYNWAEKEEEVEWE